MKLLSLLLLIACTGGPGNYSREEMLTMARLGDPDLQVKIPSLSKALVSCADYTPACVNGYVVVIKELEMKFLYYENQKDALHAAKRIKGYVARNWVLDDVQGEPLLENFVKKYFKAKLASDIK
jgi:hypothetical protein